MRVSRIVMGMPSTVELVGEAARKEDIDAIYDLFDTIDERFSTYKETSEISAINRGECTSDAYSPDMQEVMRLCVETKEFTEGYFDIKTPSGALDPSGLVKGWALERAAHMARDQGYENFYIEIAGDIQTSGTNSDGQAWRIGISNPLRRHELVAVVEPRGQGIATSGTAERGDHIYNPREPKTAPRELLSITVLAKNIYEADRLATAAFAMGMPGLVFLSSLSGVEALAVVPGEELYMTQGFEDFIVA
jgi:thiamine biosynthesis lipoprotein